MYGWWEKSTTRIQRRLLRRKSMPAAAFMPNWFVVGLGVAFCAALMISLLKTDQLRRTLAIAVSLFTACLILLTSVIQGYLRWKQKAKKKEEDARHGKPGHL